MPLDLSNRPGSSCALEGNFYRSSVGGERAIKLALHFGHGRNIDIAKKGDHDGAKYDDQSEGKLERR